MLRTLLVPTLALALAPGSPPAGAPVQRGGGGPRQTAALVQCTPNTVTVFGSPARPSQNPIADALDLAGPGTVINLDPGDYPGFTLGFGKNQPWSADTSGGHPGSPVRVVGSGRVRIRPKDGGGDTLSIDQKQPNGHFVFKNLEFEPGYRAAIMFFQQRGGRTHDGFHFEDCDIIGSFDHATGAGKKSKWAVWGQNMNDFVFRGFSRPARIENIQQEHGFYIQNPQGPILIENVRARRLGRTFCQFTAREKDGLPGIGAVTVKNCDVEDIGLSPWDGHKGGSAFTVAGRMTGPVLFERNRYRAGFAAELKRLTKNGMPYGTGALVVWDAGERVPNAAVTLRDNDFEFAEGCGDRPVVAIGGCDRVSIVGANRFVSGGPQPALSLDPTAGRDPGGKPQSAPNKAVYLDPSSKITGPIHVRGLPIDDAALSALQTPPARDSGRGGTRR